MNIEIKFNNGEIITVNIKYFKVINELETLAIGYEDFSIDIFNTNDIDNYKVGL